MKALYITLSIFFAINYNCSSQKVTNPSDSEEHSLKWFLTNRVEKSVAKNTVQLDLGVMKDLSEGIKFNATDSIDIKEQIESNNKTVFSYQNFAGKVFLNEFAITVKAKKVAHLFLKISRPIFFDDGKKLLIFVENRCGVECASGIIEVYSINPSGYELLYKKLVWIS